MRSELDLWLYFFIISRRNIEWFRSEKRHHLPLLFEWAFTWKFSTYETRLYKSINYACIWFFLHNQARPVSEIGCHSHESRFNFQYTWWLSRVICFSSTVSLKNYVPNYFKTHIIFFSKGGNVQNICSQGMIFLQHLNDDDLKQLWKSFKNRYVSLNHLSKKINDNSVFFDWLIQHANMCHGPPGRPDIRYLDRNIRVYQTGN